MLGVGAALSEMSCFVGCYVLCLVLVGILLAVGCRYLTIAYLCCMGWLEVKGMVVSVNVGFPNMAVLKLVGILRIDRSR